MHFCGLIEFLVVNAELYLPKCSDTIRGWIIDEFRAKKRTLQDELAEAVSKISISFDAWTSTSQKPVLGIYAQYITSKGVRRHVLLGRKELHGRHTAKNFALVLEETLVDYAITDLGIR